MVTLQHKVWRELWHIRGQVLAIIMVIAGGVSVTVMSLSTYNSLQTTRDTYYREYNFADLFASLKRAPLRLMERISNIPGVSLAESRVIASVHLQLEDFDEPVTGLLTSIPDHGKPRINRLHMVSGRLPDARRNNEVLVSEVFAEAHQLGEGDHITAIINGHRQTLTITGIALTPEYIYQIAPGAVFPDYKRYGVMWMANTPLSVAYDMEGAFNDVVIQLQPGAERKPVIEQLDILLRNYGGQGAYDRDDQLSNLFLKEEFSQLQNMSILFPVIFLGVAVFLLNVVVTRMVASQHEIIAILKAFGYRSVQVAIHYSMMVLVITGLGILAGVLSGIYLGQLLTSVYADYYQFPVLLYRAHPAMYPVVALITILAALAGTLQAVNQAARLPPAEAMKSEGPQIFRHSPLQFPGLQRLLSPVDKMILRHLSRKPVKSVLSVLGLSLAVAIMMVGNFQQDAVKLMMHVQFKLAQKQDIEVTFNEPLAVKVLSTLRGLPGVEYVEGLRNVPVRIHFQHRSFRTSLQGIPPDANLRQVLSSDLEPLALPDQGVMIVAHLGEKLGFKSGDRILIESLDGLQRTVPVEVASLSQQYLGVGSYMQRRNVNRLMGEGEAINSVLLSIDSDHADTIYRHLKEMPAVASINVRQNVIDSFNHTMEEVLLTFSFINALLGGIVAFGVVYNTVRITLTERGRELASMRVLGYTHAEVAYILLGELALLTLLSLGPGLALGILLCDYMSYSMQSDLFRVPLVISAHTCSLSVLVVLIASVFSGLLVWRRLHQLNLVEVLKTRE